MTFDGGPAFPGIEGPGGGYPGMTLRDYFAAAALQGYIAALADERTRAMSMRNAEESGIKPKEQVAVAVYEYADAMLKARDAK